MLPGEEKDALIEKKKKKEKTNQDAQDSKTVNKDKNLTEKKEREEDSRKSEAKRDKSKEKKSREENPSKIIFLKDMFVPFCFDSVDVQVEYLSVLTSKTLLNNIQFTCLYILLKNDFQKQERQPQ